ncbi:1-acyl-sn-glycerol-3-phosphate acyltransferase [bacterium]|nr:1-acyl-sn-glycerol-3-phosphate acyltransferase [bacterium]
MFVYHFLRFWVGGALRVWIRKIYASFEAPIPENVPIIFACTHPNSAVDYCFLPLITRKKSFVMVRGDVFANKWLDKFLRAIWMLPVYRMKDGFGTLNKNADSFQECYDEFDKNGRTMIFSEGTSIQEKQLQPLKKGTARLALDYLNSGSDKEIYVVPMANNYSRFRQFRYTVMTKFAKPINAGDYRELYQENRAKAYNQLTEDIEASLKRVLIEAKDFADDSWTERALNVLRLNRLDDRREWIIEDEGPFNEEKKLVSRFNESGESTISDDWKKSYEELQVSQDTDGLLKRSGRKDIHWMLVFSLSIFATLAYVIHFIPLEVSKSIVKKKIKDILFENTVIILGSSVFYLVQFTIVAIVLSALFGWTGFVTACSLLAISAIYSEIVDDFRFAWNNHKLVNKKAEYTRLYNDLMK